MCIKTINNYVVHITFNSKAYLYKIKQEQIQVDYIHCSYIGYINYN